MTLLAATVRRQFVLCGLDGFGLSWHTGKETWQRNRKVITVPQSRAHCGTPSNEQQRSTGNDDCCSSSNVCPAGHGDCDSDSHCVGSLVCGSDNCPWGDSDDCCAGFEVTEGGSFCEVSSDGCVHDGAGDYGNNEYCKIVAKGPIILKVEDFDTGTCR